MRKRERESGAKAIRSERKNKTEEGRKKERWPRLITWGKRDNWKIGVIG